MKQKTMRSGNKAPQAAGIKAYKNLIDRWWLKYEAAGDLEAEFPTPSAVVLSMLNSVHEHWRSCGDTSVNIGEDLRQHIAVQKVFKKWREVHGERI